MEKKKQTEENKCRVRTLAKQERNVLSKAETAGWSREICKILEWQPFFRNAGIVYFYYPLGNEADLLPLAQVSLDLGKLAAFPRTEGSGMEFFRVPDLAEFAEGAFHVMEPLSKEQMDCQKPLVFVPGLAFDVHGNRMGYGKGYYDRYFARYPECTKIGVCYGKQIIAEIPCDDYDIPVDAVASEQGIILCDTHGMGCKI